MKKRDFFLMLNIIFTLTICAQTISSEAHLLEKYPYKIGKFLRLKKNYVDVDQIYNTTTKSESIEFYNSSDKQVSVQFDRIPLFIKLEQTKFVMAPKTIKKIILLYDASQKKEWGEVEDRIMMIINNNRDVRNSILIRAYVKEDFSELTNLQLRDAPVFSMKKTLFDLGNITDKKKKKYSFTFKNNGNSDLIIRKIKSSCSCTRVKFYTKILKPKEEGCIKVVFNPKGKSGKQYKTITIITNDPQNSKVIIEIKGNIIKE